MKPAIMAALILAVLSCTDDRSEMFDAKVLRGDWVEMKNTTDTLSFEPFFDGKDLIFLKRAELYRSGPYQYQLLPDDKISIHWLLAGTMAFDEYPFKLTGDKLTIGNFYDSPSGEILTFKKVK